MAQIFHRKYNTLARASIAGVLPLAVLCGWTLHAVYWSPYSTLVDVPREQPVPFSHQHHVNDLGIDCRYCHVSVEQSAFAGLPSTETCMTCHSQVWADAPMLAPVRESLASQQRIRWNRVHDLPDFVYFNHAIHVRQGIGCATCHGPVEEMPLTWQHHTLYMKWCLECHRNPETFIRPRSEVFNQGWQPTNQSAIGRDLTERYHVRVTQLTDCGICHR